MVLPSSSSIRTTHVHFINSLDPTHRSFFLSSYGDTRQLVLFLQIRHTDPLRSSVSYLIAWWCTPIFLHQRAPSSSRFLLWATAGLALETSIVLQLWSTIAKSIFALPTQSIFVLPTQRGTIFLPSAHSRFFLLRRHTTIPYGSVSPSTMVVIPGIIFF